MKLTILSFLAGFAIINSVHAQNITFNEGTNFGISLSPDERTLAMDLQGVLWTLPTRGGSAVALTSGQQPEAREPSFSPDGERIAFQGFHNGYFHIWTINVDGTDLRQVTSGNFDDREPDWSDDNTIVYASDSAGSYDIWEVDVNSGRTRQLTNHPDDEGHPDQDGDRILFTREIRGEYSEVILAEFDGDEKTETSLIKSDLTRYYRPTWTDRGDAFTYISQQDNDTRLNYIYDVYDVAAYRDVTAIEEGDIFPFKPAWNSRGIYYTADGQIKFRTLGIQVRPTNVLVTVRDARTVDFTASITANAPEYANKKRDFDSVDPQYVRGIGNMDVSVETDNIIFSALGDLWMQQGDENAQNLTIDRSQVNDPAWTLNGRFVAYVSDRDGQMDIWVRNIANGAEQRITNDAHREYRPTWSRDGKSIAYLSTRSYSNTWGRSDLKVIDIDYGNIEVIDEGIHTPGRPAWTADGEHIIIAVADPATSRFREGMHGIRQYNIDTKQSKMLEMPNSIGLSTRDGSGPVVSRDGGKLAYISEGEIRVAYIDPAGNITGSIENRCVDPAHMPRWSKDDEKIYYLAGRMLRSCNYLTGEVENRMINATWQRAQAGDKTIHVEKLFDGVGDRYRENVDVFVSGGRITKISPHGQDPVVGEFLDYSRNTMIPGLMAGHSHQSELRGQKLGRNWLAYGITSVRDPGSNPYKSLMRKETWESGKMMGPRMFYAGWLTGGARVYYGQSYNAITERALWHEIYRMQDLDYDMVKSYVRLPDEYQQLLVREAHKIGIPLSSHEIAPAVQNSMDSVEHIAATSRRGYSPKFSYMAKSYDDVISIIARSGLFITPTAVLDSSYHEYIERFPQYESDVKYRTFLDPYERNLLIRARNSANAQKEIKQIPAVNETIKKLHDAGANFAAGTDSPFLPYGIAQHMEIIQYVNAGLSPADAIRASTINVAKNLGVDSDLGTLEVGKLADMVILSGDPLDDITDIHNVQATIRGGHHYTIQNILDMEAR